jgi:hypothetical protein
VELFVAKENINCPNIKKNLMEGGERVAGSL